jgi:CubicO group peptidase (beta-lactamase class C family)
MISFSENCGAGAHVIECLKLALRVLRKENQEKLYPIGPARAGGVAMRRWTVSAGCACVLALGCAMGAVLGSAQATDEAALKARMEQVAQSYTPGNAYMGTALVVNGDKVLLDKGYGMADLEWGNANAPDVKFRLGSLTKQFTAALVLLLQEDGKLNIDDPVSKYLPETPKTWEKITLAELLGHTSGIPNFTDLKEFGVWRMSPHTVEEELAFFKDKPLDFEPGSKFAYSNSNFEVLGAVIEKVSGKKYVDELQERILTPLGMKDSGLDTDELILPRRAQGYMQGKDGLQLARSESMSVPWAAGSMYSTTGDLLKWERGLFGGKVLNADSLKRMTTPGKGDYGLGVFIADKDGVKVVRHGGGIEGFNTYLAYVPEKKIAVVVLANVNGAAPGQMGDQLTDLALGKPVTLASERKAVPIAKEELAKFVGVYDLDAGVSMTFAVGADGLTGQVGGQPAFPLMYVGLKDGHPRFLAAKVGAEIEFVPDASGAFASIVLHQGGENLPGKKH